MDKKCRAHHLSRSDGRSQSWAIREVREGRSWKQWKQLPNHHPHHQSQRFPTQLVPPLIWSQQSLMLLAMEKQNCQSTIISQFHPSLFPQPTHSLEKEVVRLSDWHECQLRDQIPPEISLQGLLALKMLVADSSSYEKKAQTPLNRSNLLSD